MKRIMTMKRGTLTALAAVLTVLTGPALAQTSTKPESARGTDYCERSLGLWFYCQRPAPVEPEPTQAPAPSATSEMTPPEIVELEDYKRRLDRAREIATWRPTEETVAEYYQLQQIATDKAGLFADHWRRMIWMNPEFDYTYTRPVVEAAKHGWTDDRLTDRDLFLRGVSDKVGLFYVYRGSCGPCRIASPIIKSFSDRYGMAVRAISADGAPNPEFPSAVRDQGQLQAWGVRNMTPALLFFQASDVDARTGQVQPRRVRGSNGQMIELLPCTKPRGCLTYAGAGVMAQEDIAERLFVLLSKTPGSDF